MEVRVFEEATKFLELRRATTLESERNRTRRSICCGWSSFIGHSPRLVAFSNGGYHGAIIALPLRKQLPATGNMKTDELREKYLEFFETKGCVRRPSDLRAVPSYLAMSYLYKKSNRFWHQLIRHRLTARV